MLLWWQWLLFHPSEQNRWTNISNISRAELVQFCKKFYQVDTNNYIEYTMIPKTTRKHTVYRRFGFTVKTKLVTRKSQKWFTRYCVKTANVSTLEKQEDHWEQEWKNIAKKWTASQESLLEQKRPGQLVSATSLQLQIMFATRIMW